MGSVAYEGEFKAPMECNIRAIFLAARQLSVVGKANIVNRSRLWINQPLC